MSETGHWEHSALVEAREIGTISQKARWLRDKKLIELLQRDNIDVDLFIGKKQDMPKMTAAEKLLHVLHKPVSQLLLAMLMVLDSVLIIGEIVLEVRMFLCGLKARELQISRLVYWMMHYYPPLANWNGADAGRFTAQNTDGFIHYIDAVGKNLSQHGSGFVCYVPQASDNSSSAVGASGSTEMEELEKRAEKLETEMVQYEAVIEAIAISSIVVLALFVLEVLLKFVAMGPRKFLKSKLEVFDAAIIFASFAVDVATYCSNDPNPESTVLIVLLIWRIVRLVNGFLMHEKQTAEAHNHIMQKVHSLMKLEVKYLKRINSLQREKLGKYQDLCVRHRVAREDINRIEALHPAISIEETLKQQEQEEHELQQKRFPHNLTVFFGHRKPSMLFKKHSSALLTSPSHAHLPPKVEQVQAQVEAQADVDAEAEAEAEADAEKVTFLDDNEQPNTLS